MSSHDPTEEGFPVHMVGAFGASIGALAGGAAGRLIGMAVDGGHGGGENADVGFFVGILLGALFGYGLAMLLQLAIGVILDGDGVGVEPEE